MTDSTANVRGNKPTNPRTSAASIETLPAAAKRLEKDGDEAAAEFIGESLAKPRMADAGRRSNRPAHAAVKVWAVRVNDFETLAGRI